MYWYVFKEIIDLDWFGEVLECIQRQCDKDDWQGGWKCVANEWRIEWRCAADVMLF